MATLQELFDANEWEYDLEPWNVGDGEIININGADMFQLCEDGVALWNNDELEWTEVEPSHILMWDKRLGLENFDKLVSWMVDFWETEGILDDSIKVLVGKRLEQSGLLDDFPEIEGMPFEPLADFLEESGKDDLAQKFRVYAERFPHYSIKQEFSPSPEERAELPYHQEMEKLRNYKPEDDTQKSLRRKYKSLKRYYY